MFSFGSFGFKSNNLIFSFSTIDNHLLVVEVYVYNYIVDKYSIIKMLRTHEDRFSSTFKKLSGSTSDIINI